MAAQNRSFQSAIALSVSCLILASGTAKASTHDDLVDLFKDWRAFESPPLLDGAPDYTAERFEARQPEFLALRARLGAFDISPSRSTGISFAPR
jgi:hypothetical protein